MLQVMSRRPMTAIMKSRSGKSFTGKRATASVWWHAKLDSLLTYEQTLPRNGKCGYEASNGSEKLLRRSSWFVDILSHSILVEAH